MSDWDRPVIPCRHCGLNTDEVGRVDVSTSSRAGKDSLLFCTSCWDAVRDIIDTKFSKDWQRRKDEWERRAPVDSTARIVRPKLLEADYIDAEFTEE